MDARLSCRPKITHARWRIGDTSVLTEEIADYYFSQTLSKLLVLSNVVLDTSRALATTNLTSSLSEVVVDFNTTEAHFAMSMSVLLAHPLQQMLLAIPSCGKCDAITATLVHIKPTS